MRLGAGAREGGRGREGECDPPQLEAAQLAGGASEGGLPIHPPEVLGADLGIPVGPASTMSLPLKPCRPHLHVHPKDLYADTMNVTVIVMNFACSPCEFVRVNSMDDASTSS